MLLALLTSAGVQASVIQHDLSVSISFSGTCDSSPGTCVLSGNDGDPFPYFIDQDIFGNSVGRLTGVRIDFHADVVRDAFQILGSQGGGFVTSGNGTASLRISISDPVGFSHISTPLLTVSASCGSGPLCPIATDIEATAYDHVAAVDPTGYTLDVGSSGSFNVGLLMIIQGQTEAPRNAFGGGAHLDGRLSIIYEFEPVGEPGVIALLVWGFLLLRGSARRSNLVRTGAYSRASAALCWRAIVESGTRRAGARVVALSVAIGTLLCAGVQAHGAALLTQVRTNSGASDTLNGSYGFGQFDPQLGTLTGVEVLFSSDLRNTLSYSGTASGDFATTIQFQIGASADSRVVLDNGFASPPGVSTQVVPAINILPGDLSAFIGTGSIAAGVALDLVVSNLTENCAFFFCLDPVARSFLVDDIAELRYTFDPLPAQTGRWVQTRGGSAATNARGGSYRFSQFDPQLGTLTGVEVLFSSDLRNTLSYSGTASADFATTIQFHIGPSADSRVILDSGFTHPPGESTQVVPPIDLLPGDFSAFIGTGSIAAGVGLNLVVSNLTENCALLFCLDPVAGSFLVDDIAELRYTFRYDDRAAVPEPPVIGLLSLGIGLFWRGTSGARRSAVRGRRSRFQ